MEGLPLTGWDSYQCNINDEIASVYLNLDLLNTPVKQHYPLLNWYWIKLKNPRKDGLSSQEEFDSLVTHEDNLMTFLEKYPIIFAGRITTQGRREFYFYSKDEVVLSTIINPFIGDEAVFQFQTGEEADPEWTLYKNLLYPGENGKLQITERNI